MFDGSLPTPLSPMLAIRCLDLSPEAEMGFRRRFSTLLSTRLHSSARSVSSLSCAAKPAPTICKVFRAGCAFAAACRLHGYLHAFLGWHTSIGRIFWEVLFVQRCARCWWKSWAALARRAGALWQPCLALLLPDRAESDLRGRTLACNRPIARSPVVRFTTTNHDRCAWCGCSFPRRNA